MAKTTAITLTSSASEEMILSAAYEDVAEKFRSPKGWMGVRTVNLVDDDEKVVGTYLVKFRSCKAELFEATGHELALPNKVTPKYKAPE